MSRRKTIGIITNDIDGNYHTIQWLMINRAAEEFDCNLIVFEGRALMCDSKADRQHHIIYEFVDKNKIDGLILTGGTLSCNITKDRLLKFLGKYEGIPIISLSEDIPGFTRLLLENKIGMKRLIDHLIKDHGYKRIIFVTGPKENFDSNERYEAYLEGLNENGIMIDEEYVFHGEFNSESGYAVMKEILKKGIVYDAIVCANDDMAVGAMKYMKDLKASEKIDLSGRLVICGFDDSLIASFLKPGLTTVRQPMKEMCMLAFELILKKIDGQPVDDITRLPTIVVTRESCGCKNNCLMDEINNATLRLLTSYRFHEIVQTYSLDELYTRITNSVEHCHIRSCFISTYKEGTFIYDANSIFDGSLVFPEDSQLIYSYYDYKYIDLDNSECCFNTKHIVPDKFWSVDRRFTYLVNPLFFNNEHFGFVVFEAINDDVTMFEPLRGNISNTLKGALMLIERKKIEENLLETERLASLGQLIGGISHNMLTPIMSISGGLEAVGELIGEYRNSIDNREVTIEDHMEIADEMMSRIDSVKGFISYMSDVITTVRTQAVQLNFNTTSKFTLHELIGQIKFVISNNECYKKFQLEIKADKDIKAVITGDISNFMLIIRNLLSNAVQSYDDKNNNDNEGRKVDIFIEKSTDQVLIKVKDYGKGISNSIKNRIFKTMFTTKGKNGNGLSLMLSYSTIKAKYGGDMWFESEPDKGSTFYISIPVYDEH